jgi:hypothetical protein
MKTEQTESPHYKIGFELSKVKYNLVDAKCYRFTRVYELNKLAGKSDKYSIRFALIKVCCELSN